MCVPDDLWWLIARQLLFFNLAALYPSLLVPSKFLIERILKVISWCVGVLNHYLSWRWILFFHFFMGGACVDIFLRFLTWDRFVIIPRIFLLVLVFIHLEVARPFFFQNRFLTFRVYTAHAWPDWCTFKTIQAVGLLLCLLDNDIFTAIGDRLVQVALTVVVNSLILSYRGFLIFGIYNPSEFKVLRCSLRALLHFSPSMTYKR